MLNTPTGLKFQNLFLFSLSLSVRVDRTIQKHANFNICTYSLRHLFERKSVTCLKRLNDKVSCLATSLTFIGKQHYLNLVEVAALT